MLHHIYHQMKKSFSTKRQFQSGIPTSRIYLVYDGWTESIQGTVYRLCNPNYELQWSFVQTEQFLLQYIMFLGVFIIARPDSSRNLFASSLKVEHQNTRENKDLYQAMPILPHCKSIPTTESTDERSTRSDDRSRRCRFANLRVCALRIQH